WSFANYEQSQGPPTGLHPIERTSRWLLNTSLFEQAWASVCFGKLNWWWSQQLCLFTVGAWTIFLATEGRRHRVKIIWAYMLLGQLVAISVASNLFYLALVLARPPPPSTPSPAAHTRRASTQRAPPALWLPVLLSLGTVATSPLTSARTFLPNLLLMHTLIVLPLLAPDTLFPFPSDRPEKPKPFLSLGLPTLYVLVFGAALALHTRATTVALGDPALSFTAFARSAWTTLHAHPAQASIGWDVIWTSLSFVVWQAVNLEKSQGGGGGSRRLVTAAYLLLATPLVSVGVLAPHVLRPRPREDDEAQEREKKDA
ncbi:hypothetical protein B0H14DRAFT_2352632, partial [Mycena olivaceomarginata]